MLAFAEPPTGKNFMTISQAIQNSAQTVAAAQLTYLQNVVAVTTAMTAVSSASLPVLNDPPANWAQFTSTFTQAKTNAQAWVNDVLSRLLDVPDEVDQNNSIITNLLTNCSSYATALQQGSNPEFLSALNTDLGLLTSQLQTVTIFITSCQQAVSSFNDNLPTLLQQLQALVTDFSNTENADSAEITTLQANIVQLNSDISTQGSLIATEGVLAGAAIYIGRISGWTPVGVLVKLLCFATVAASTYGIDMAANQIANDKATIAQDTTEMSQYTQDIASCQVLVNYFTAFVNEMSAITASVQAVLTQWQTMQSEVNAAVADVQKALADVKGAAFNNALVDLQNAASEWTAIDKLAVSLEIQINVTTANVEPGMTASQVQAAVAGSSYQDVISYLNSAAA